MRVFIYLLYGLCTHKIIHNSEESQVWTSHESLQESTTVRSRFKPIFKCTSCYS